MDLFVFAEMLESLTPTLPSVAPDIISAMGPSPDEMIIQVRSKL